MAGGRTAGVVAAMGLVLVGCWKDNPAFFVTEGTDTGPDGSTAEATTEASLVTTVPATTEPATTEPATTEPATTAVDPSAATSTSSTSGSTSGPDLTTTSTTTSDTGTTSGDGTGSSTTGEDLVPVCGATGYGPAELLARQWYGLSALQCADIPGRNYLVVDAEEGMITGFACSADPLAGCTGCDPVKSLRFSFSTPEPDGVIELSKCVYIAAHGAEDPGAPDLCRFKQMALWWNDSSTPGKSPPLAIFGHDTLAVDYAVEMVTDATLAVQLVPKGGECGCVDANDCCPDKAVEYSLGFATSETVELAPGQHGEVLFAGATYEAYNGQSYETGACGQVQRFDWWLLRQ